MNNSLFLGILVSATLLAACEDGAPTNRQAMADNTAVNERDRNTASVTPMDQGQSASDVEITARIRRAIMEEEGMSIDAQNVKIVTVGGAVTLRGPVANESERTLIAAKANTVAGVTRVDDQLDIKNP